jgi:KipI family sensor histidine kinase inhibitor
LISFSLTYKPFGESAILIEWPSEMKGEILKDIGSFYQRITQKDVEGVIETIQSINSLTVIYKSDLISSHKLKKSLIKIYAKGFIDIQQKYFLWKIPVCYDSVFSLDLEEISTKIQLPVEDIIQLHTESIYRVFSIGFLPGFLYLGGLDKRLHFDRKSTPRLEVPKGAVGIGGKQTGIYPKSSPGGWQIIGNTPITFFDKTKAVPCFAKPGDQIQFFQISHNEYQQIQRQVSLKEFLIEKEEIDD